MLYVLNVKLNQNEVCRFEYVLKFIPNANKIYVKYICVNINNIFAFGF